jgi:hypothetical protein
MLLLLLPRHDNGAQRCRKRGLASIWRLRPRCKPHDRGGADQPLAHGQADRGLEQRGGGVARRHEGHPLFSGVGALSATSRRSGSGGAAAAAAGGAAAAAMALIAAIKPVVFGMLIDVFLSLAAQGAHRSMTHRTQHGSTNSAA